MKFGLGGEYSVYTGYFWTQWPQVILGSLNAFPFFDKPVSRKWLVVERKGVKFRPLGWIFSVYRILLTLNASGNSGGHSVYFWFSKTLCLENGRSWKIHLVKDTSRSLCYPVLCGHCLPSCQAERQAPGLLVVSVLLRTEYKYLCTRAYFNAKHIQKEQIMRLKSKYK